MWILARQSRPADPLPGRMELPRSASNNAILPCPMCEGRHVEVLQELPDTRLYVCLACGYRFALRFRLSASTRA